MPYQKSIEEYRRDIFALKTKLRQQTKYLEQIKQIFSDVDIFGQQKSYSFNLKLKILDYNLNAIKQNMEKYMQDEAFDFYAINFATLALVKSTEVLMINREMIFRALDIKYLGKISRFDMLKFLKQTLKMHQEFIKSILQVLDPDNKDFITKQRYTKYLQCFLINSQQGVKEINTIDIACQNIAKKIIYFNSLNQSIAIKPQLIWKAKEINIAILGQGLSRKLGKIDVLDCVGFYCKLDPMKKGFIETKNAVNFLNSKINDVKSFGGAIKLQK